MLPTSETPITCTELDFVERCHNSGGLSEQQTARVVASLRILLERQRELIKQDEASYHQGAAWMRTRAAEELERLAARYETEAQLCDLPKGEELRRFTAEVLRALAAHVRELEP